MLQRALAGVNNYSDFKITHKNTHAHIKEKSIKWVKQTKMDFPYYQFFLSSTMTLTVLWIWVVGWCVCVGDGEKLIGFWNSGALRGFVK